MLRSLFLLIILLHGMIHFMGFAKAFGYGDMKQLTLPISKTAGILWLLTTFLFLLTALLFYLKHEAWMWTAIPTAILSQVLIVMAWQDARLGTIANIIVLMVAVLSITTLCFEKRYRADVQRHMERIQAQQPAMISQADIAALPAPLQRYLRYSGVVGNPHVVNMFAKFNGRMRSKKQDWFEFTAEQYNFFDQPTRLFFMKAKMFGLTVPGYHRYENGKASMDIRLFGLIPVVKVEGEDMSKGETVTLFNDMCLMAPASLLDQRVRWQAVDEERVKAVFINGNIIVSAVLYFNAQGQLINFTSDDRYEVNLKQYLPFSTPVTAYQPLERRNVLSHGEAVWYYREGPFAYGSFDLAEIQFNVQLTDKYE